MKNAFVQISKYLMFQGEPFMEENYCAAITALEQSMDKYDPSLIGYAWDDENPRIQLEPRGERGYIDADAGFEFDDVLVFINGEFLDGFTDVGFVRFCDSFLNSS